MSGPFEIPFAPNKQPVQRGFDGDQFLVSQDQSVFRQGSASNITSGQFYALCGNQPIMGYWSHNVALDSNFNFLGRDEADSCSIMALCEDNTMRFFGAPTGARKTYPVFTQSYSIDMLATNGTEPRAGSTGQLISATIVTPGTSLTTATPANVITTPFLVLTPGRWDIFGQIAFLPAATTSITQIAFGINSVSATLPAAGSGGLVQNTFAAVVPTAIPQCYNVTTTRVNISVNTTYYLVAQATFTVSTLSAFGTLYAERR